MATVTSSDAVEVMRRLEAEGYRPILIGGLAIEVAGYGGTKDVDILLPSAEYGGAEYLRSEGLTVLSNTGNFTNGHLQLPGGRTVVWDVLNPDLFGGEPFYEFVRSRASKAWVVGRIAAPPVVYYTRLLVKGDHGRRYMLRIRRDLDEGAPDSWVRGTIAIAKRFGTEATVLPKVDAIFKERRRELGSGHRRTQG
jgi:hypothetical protein